MNQRRVTRIGAWGRWLALGLAACATAVPGFCGEVRPEDFGARGDAEADDTQALRSALQAAAGGTLVLTDGRRYRLSSPLVVSATTRLTGKGVLVATPALEAKIGPVSDAGVLTIGAGADRSEVSGVTIDLAGTGRTALQVNADDVVVRDVEVRDYAKPVKSDGRRYSTSDAGVRVHGHRVAVAQVRCFDMRTGQPDSVPRCITVQAGARGTRLSAVSGERINGGITVGRSSDTLIDGWKFKDLEDNGLYVLPDAAGTVALDGELHNTEEPAVFKGTGTRVKGLRLVNQGRALGIENARDLVLESVQVDFREGFDATPAFLRARRGNRSSTGIVIRGVTGRMLLGDSVLSLGTGAVNGLVVEDFSLELQAGLGSKHRRFVLRHAGGTPPPRLENVHLEVVGSPGSLPQTLWVSLAKGEDSAAIARGIAITMAGRGVEPGIP